MEKTPLTWRLVSWNMVKIIRKYNPPEICDDPQQNHAKPVPYVDVCLGLVGTTNQARCSTMVKPAPRPERPNILAGQCAAARPLWTMMRPMSGEKDEQNQSCSN